MKPMSWVDKEPFRVVLFISGWILWRLAKIKVPGAQLLLFKIKAFIEYRLKLLRVGTAHLKEETEAMEEEIKELDSL